MVGNKREGFAVLDKHGAIEYDLLKDRLYAKKLCAVLNKGIGPEWDKVQPVLKRSLVHRIDHE